MVLPSLVDLEQVNIAALSVVPLDTPQSELRSTLLQVSAIRFTHDTIDGRAIFMHDESGHKKHVDDRTSIYQTLDELWRGRVKPGDLPPLEVVLCDGKLWSINNRRLADLKMFQALSQHETVWVTCTLRPPNHPKFRPSKTTQTDGLSIRLRCVDRNIPFHMDALAFNQAAQTMHGTVALQFQLISMVTGSLPILSGGLIEVLWENESSISHMDIDCIRSREQHAVSECRSFSGATEGAANQDT
jgi:hypothetical protein